MDQTAIIPYSVEGILFGINCVLYGFCVYTLWGQKSISCRLLLLINTVHCLLCATQTILCTIFYFVVFTIFTGDTPSNSHHISDYVLGSVAIFITTFITAGFLSIWRLCVLYDNDIKICIPAFVIWIAQICAGVLTVHIVATRPAFSTTFSPVNMSLWALIALLNLCVAVPICIRLCIAQKRTHTVLGPSPYKSVAIVLVECGALITVCSVGMTILYACNHTYALGSIGVATEVAIASQLLVTARHGMLSQDRPNSGSTSTAHGVNVVRTEPRRPVDPPMEPLKAKSLCSFTEPTSQEELASAAVG